MKLEHGDIIQKDGFTHIIFNGQINRLPQPGVIPSYAKSGCIPIVIRDQKYYQELCEIKRRELEPKPEGLLSEEEWKMMIFPQ